MTQADRVPINHGHLPLILSWICRVGKAESCGYRPELTRADKTRNASGGYKASRPRSQGRGGHGPPGTEEASMTVKVGVIGVGIIGQEHILPFDDDGAGAAVVAVSDA